MITLGATALWLMPVALVPIIAAQTVVEANCTDPQFDWMFNSLSLSPCHVADQIVLPCISNGFTIPPLPLGNQYFGPLIGQNNTCICTSVYYSLLSACAACQDRSWIPWTQFTTNCTAPSLTTYPNTIPAGVKVPHWAYLDVSTGDSFNVADALNAGSGPESTILASTTSTGSTSTPSSNSSPTSSSQSSSAGAIAGGVIGGIVGLALIVGIAIFFYRRGQHKSDQPNGPMRGPDVLSTSPPPPTAWNASSLVPALRPQKLYDPQDPSTFPTSVHTSQGPIVAQSLTGTTYTTTREDAQQSASGTTHYRGVPEVYD